MGVELRSAQLQQVCSSGLQCFQFFGIHIRALVFFETEDEAPTRAFVRRYERACAATLTSARQRDALLDDASTQVCIDEAALHFGDGSAERLISQLGLSHPAGEEPSLEDATHAALYHCVYYFRRIRHIIR